MPRPFARPTRAAVLVVLYLLVTVDPAVAQTDPTSPDATSVPPASVVPGGTTTTTIACPVFAGPDAQFLGTATSVGDVVVRFHVDQVEGGNLSVENVDVDYPDDARFVHVGTRYRVPMLRDAESDRFVSKVRPVAPDRGGVVAECAKKDPVLTTLASGDAIDTGVFSGLHGKSGRVRVGLRAAYRGRARRPHRAGRAEARRDVDVQPRAD